MLLVFDKVLVAFVQMLSVFLMSVNETFQEIDNLEHKIQLECNTQRYNKHLIRILLHT